MFDVFEASLQQIAVRWRSNGLPERTCEMVRGKSGHRSKSFQAYPLFEMRFDVAADPMGERWRKPSAAKRRNVCSRQVAQLSDPRLCMDDGL